ncbi:DUF2721 domain-containing protein [Armatimonas rosea]|uniref:DUF2721 domain-containing protein n=1 Tax=Armatimonas rosea TaxID=685828 RepID=A0A7W9SPH2_ARMRO|nr:DUF2721 domain-containing protein [Armatimonas rosea]MBB6050452.1 hypothetical protein [Armatimonas rosea]
MDISLTTPALLFPAVSLILLAYTNRFLALAALTRSLYERWGDTHDPKIPPQIENLRYRVRLIRRMQTLGVSAILLCVVAMFCLFENWLRAGAWFFGASLVALSLSLTISLHEIQLSGRALDMQLADMEAPAPPSSTL